MDESNRDHDPIETLVDAILSRIRLGERPTPEDLSSWCPDLTDDLPMLFQVIDALERVHTEFGGGHPGVDDEDPDRSRYPRQLGDYRLLRVIGRGGMGVVFEAQQLSLDRRVALKILPRNVAFDSKILKRFRREARSAARLHHSNIVPVFEVGRHGEVAYYAMQFIPGRGLDEVIEGLRGRRDRSGRLGAPTPGPGPGPVPVSPDDPQSAAGTGARPGIDHGRPVEGDRDRGDADESLMPVSVPSPVGSSWVDETLVLAGSSDGRVPEQRGDDPSGIRPEPPGPIPVEQVLPVLDPARRPESFREIARIGRQVAEGLSYAHGRGVIHRDIKPSNLLLDGDGVAWITDFGLAQLDEDFTLTRTGDLIGTTRYMAPERFRGEGDARADVYALGLTLYELLTLRPAFPETDRLTLIDRIKSEDPPRPRSIDPGIPRDLETIVLKATEKDPEARYQTASALAEDLRRFLAGRPIEARPLGPIGRLVRACRRHPVPAALGGTVLALLVLIAVGSAIAAIRLDRRARQVAGANFRLSATRDELRRNLYASEISSALASWYANQVGRLDIRLDRAREQARGLDLLGWEYDYLRRLSRQERETFLGHSREVSRVAFSPDGRLVASMQWGGRVLVWDPATGEIRWTLPEADAPGFSGPRSPGVSALAFSPDGRRLAAQGPDRRVACFDVESGELIFSTSAGGQVEPPAVLDLAFSPDGLMLAAATAEHAILLWDGQDGSMLLELPGAHPASVADVEFSPDGLTLASADFEGTVMLRDARAPARADPVSFRAHDDAIRDLVFAPDGQSLATGGKDGTVRIWDRETRIERDRLQPDCPDVVALAYSPDGRRLASAGVGQLVTLWEVDSGRTLRTFKGHHDSVYTLAYAPDGRSIASAGADRTVRLWDPEHPAQPQTLVEPGSGSEVGSGPDPGPGLRLRIGAARLFRRPYGLDISPDGSRIAAGFEDSTVRIWNMPEESPTLVVSPLEPDDPRLERAVECVAFSPDGRAIASGDPDFRISIWDSETGELLRTLERHDDSITDLAFLPDGRAIASASNDGRLILWDLETGEPRFTFEGQPLGIRDLDIGLDGRTIASASNDGTVVILDASNGRRVLSFDEHVGSACAVSYSPDGRLIASAGADGTVRLWEANTGRVLRVLTGHAATVLAVAFHPDGRRIASAGADRTIRLWDPAGGLELLSLTDHSGWVRRVRFSPDGRCLISVSDDGTLKVRDALALPEDPTPEAPPPPPPGVPVDS